MWKKSFVLSLCLLFIMVLLTGCNIKPKAGDCVDVSEYGMKETTRYCTIAGNVQRVPSGWAFDLKQPCKFYVCEYCTEGCLPDFSDCHNGHWADLSSANTIDGKIVSKIYCN